MPSSNVQSFLKDLKQKKRHKDQQTSLLPPAKAVSQSPKAKRKRDADPKRTSKSNEVHASPADVSTATSATTAAAVPIQTHTKRSKSSRAKPPSTVLPVVLPPHRHVLAPMVGASELPFRLLCRMYGAESCYTPMMDATQFADPSDSDSGDSGTNTVAHHATQKAQQYRRLYHLEHAVHEADHPLVAHVSANTPDQLARAAVTAARLRCDQVDLNLGCPQRTAFVGHYGSYLLDEPDWIVKMVATAVEAVRGAHARDSACPLIPLSVKIRLLTTVEETIDFCRRLCGAGVSLIAIHARHRASWERTSAGARDGPALLDYVAAIAAAVGATFPHVAIVTNGNTITYADVQSNLQMTNASGCMSAEGILDNPALFVERYGSRSERDKLVTVWKLSRDTTIFADKMIAKLQRRLRDIARLEQTTDWSDDETKLVASKERRQRKLAKLLAASSSDTNVAATMKQTQVTLGSLYDAADDKWQLARQYLDLATAFPVPIRTVVFHIRRMLKDMLVQYQVLDDCLKCTTMEQVSAILDQMDRYRTNPASFVYDAERAKLQADAVARKRLEEGKRKAYEARMMRKAKREGRSDLHYYLNQGAALPTADEMAHYQCLPREQVLGLWKQKHSQHCLSFHLDRCHRDRACAFLHVELATSAFRETDEIAG